MSDEEHDTDRPPPPPPLGLDQLVGLFLAGRIGQQARNAPIKEQQARDAAALQEFMPR